MNRPGIEQIKNRASKKNNGLTMEIYRDFSENTSIHGLKYTTKKEIPMFEKIFWAIVVISCLCGAAYMTILFWQRYTSNPTRTTIWSNYASTSNIYFPAVTICNIYRILGSKIDHFASRLDVTQEDDRDVLKKVLFQLTGFTTPTDKIFNETELSLAQDILEKNEITDMIYVMRKISQSCDDLFLYCVWNKERTPCPSIFQQSITSSGVCCSFNYLPPNSKAKPLYTSFSGFGTGLKLVVQPSTQSEHYKHVDGYAPGVKVRVHGPYDYPGSESILKLITVGRMMFLQIMGANILCSHSVKMLPVDHRKCVYPNEYHLKYFERYIHTNCINECEALQYYKACGCVPFYYNFADKPICNITKIPCLQKVKIGDIIEKSTTKCEDCPAPCEDTFYNIISSSTSMNYNQTKSTLNSLYGMNVSNDKIVLNIYFWSNRQTVFLRDTITSTLYLLSSFGGVYGLFLGCSFITIIEILYYFIVRFAVNSKFFNGVVQEDTSKAAYKHNLGFGNGLNGFYYPPNKYLN